MSVVFMPKMIWLLFMIAAVSTLSAVAYSGRVGYAEGCNMSVTNSGSNYTVQQGCANISINVQPGVSNAGIRCNNAVLDKNSSVSLYGDNNNVWLYDCDIENANIRLYNNTELNLVSWEKPEFTPSFAGSNSKINVGYYLNINVFEPFGANSAATFGNRLTFYGYIIPSLNDTIKLNSSQMQLDPPFSKHMSDIFAYLSQKVPFGIYNQSSIIYLPEPKHTDYGIIYGNKTFILPGYTISNGKFIRYGPYYVDYSFFAYDQLIMFKLDMNSSMNITPMYIAPQYPSFNYNVVPDNNQKNMTITWLVAIPPQDRNWTFSYYIYRYHDGFVLNPINNSIASSSSFVDLLDYPNQNYSYNENGTLIYILNYTSGLSLGMNSSITLANGTAENGKIRFIQDSTTPSFSFGLAFCSSMYNYSVPYSRINRPGYYNMIDGTLHPVSSPAGTSLGTAPCGIGALVIGNNIIIDCRNGTILASTYGIEVLDSKNITIMNCRLSGNGIYVSNSSYVNIYNTDIAPNSTYNGSGLWVNVSHNITFVNFGVYGTFSEVYAQNNSQNIKFYNLSAVDQSIINLIASQAEVTGSFVTTKPENSSTAKQTSAQDIILYAGSGAILAVYVLLFYKLQYATGKRIARARKRGK